MASNDSQYQRRTDSLVKLQRHNIHLKSQKEDIENTNEVMKEDLLEEQMIVILGLLMIQRCEN